MDRLILVATYGWRKDRLDELESHIGDQAYHQDIIKRGISYIKELDKVNKHDFTSHESYHIMHTEMAIDQDIPTMRHVPLFLLHLLEFVLGMSVFSDITRMPRLIKKPAPVFVTIGLFASLFVTQILYIPMYRKIKWNLSQSLKDNSASWTVKYRKRKLLKAFHIWAIKKAIPNADLTDIRKLTHDIGAFINGL